MMTNFAVASFTLLILVQSTDADVFASMAEMEELISTEAVLVSLLESYVIAYEEKCEYLKRYYIYGR